MAHSSSRTLLARMGFADPDLKTSEHDQACQYITTPEVVAKLLPLAYPGYDSGGRPCRYLLQVKCVHHEVMLTKGSENYKSTVGFVDAVIETVGVRECWFNDRWDREISVYPKIGVEVKIAREAVASTLRQMAVYKEFSDVNAWVLATRYPLSVEDVRQLTENRIVHVRLGDAFTRYMQSQERQDSLFVESPSKEL